MSPLTLLAQSATAAGNADVIPIDVIWEQIVSLSWLQALIAVSFGAVYLMYGWRIFKVLVVISFGLMGLFLGIYFGDFFGSKLWSGIIGLCLLGAVSIPLMRWAVSLLGAIAGGIITGGIWYAFELPEKYILAGAIIGLVAGGMISFIVFRVAIMLFTSLAGGILIVTGMLSLLYHYENAQSPPTANIQDLVFNSHWFLPVMMIFATALGIILQNNFVKNSSSYKV
ncbi:MAG: hypothetical protein FVQ80_02410 [Planctomycetes bacterium]|nr:hypothetical protein [Planctomycetota bacterium]